MVSMDDAQQFFLHDPYVLLNIEATDAARDEVALLWYDDLPEANQRLIDDAFDDVAALFAGSVPGYRPCSTPYHSIGHTMLVTVAMARILDGARRSGVADASTAVPGILAALYHDSGYIQDADNDAEVALSDHEQRSVDQLRRFAASAGIDEPTSARATSAIARRPVSERNGCDSGPPTGAGGDSTDEEPTLATLLLYADLLGQMADRAYLEKLLLLYGEFRRTGVDAYRSEIELLRGTAGFYGSIATRSRGRLSQVSAYLRAHFAERAGAARDLYSEYVEKNMDYLASLLTIYRDEYRDRLRRLPTDPNGLPLAR